MTHVVRTVLAIALAAPLAVFGANADATSASPPERPSHPALALDFTAGVPAGGSLRPFATCDGDGLRATSGTNALAAAGFILDRPQTPSGAFLMEAAFVPDAIDETTPVFGMLWDDMGVNYAPERKNRGFQVMLDRRGAVWTPVFYGGFSNTTVMVRGPTAPCEPGVAVTLSLRFGADGWISWDFGGVKMESELPRLEPLAASAHRPVVGDRVIANFRPFRGAIRRLYLTQCPRGAFAMRRNGRAAFVRGETGAQLKFECESIFPSALGNVRATAEQIVGDKVVLRREYALGHLAPHEKACFDLDVETRFHPGWHACRVRIAAQTETGDAVEVTRTFRLGIGPRHADRMTALMWDGGPFKAVSDFGFTHVLRHYDQGFGSEFDGSVYDDALVEGLGMVRSIRKVLYPPGDNSCLMRMDRGGKFPTNDQGREIRAPEVSRPEFLEWGRAVVSEDARAFADYPAFCGVLPNSEMRDTGFPSFNTEHLRYKAESGRDVPEEVVVNGDFRGRVLDASHIAEMRRRFPNGVIPSDNPILAYYRWYWKGGDGWPGYVGGLARAYRENISRPEFLTMWDPGVRCPAIWGSGGGVDMLNHWVYAEPEPMNVAGPAEEVLAMTAGCPGQIPAITTQLICYRRQVAPLGRKVLHEPAWARAFPQGRFPAIAPDALQEAVWSMIAKPVKAVMFGGWGCIYDTGDKTRWYNFTNPETPERLRELLTGLVAPLGPMLKRLGRDKPPVAMLESFTTCVFGGPLSWGWHVQPAMLLQRARLDPRIIYEETILRDGLDDVKVLYAPQCHFLTRDVIEAIRAFQRRGGILVADDELLGALKADITIPWVKYDPFAMSDHPEDIEALEAVLSGKNENPKQWTSDAKARMLQGAETLRRKLAPRYIPSADSSSPEIVVYNRRWRDAKYLFAINDHRTFGDYFGPWGLTMEKGLSYEGWVSLDDSEGKVGAVYELSRGGECAFVREGGKVKVPVKFETNDGRMFVFLEKKIASVEAEAPEAVPHGGVCDVVCTVKGADGWPVSALLPVEIRLYDAEGREIDGGGWLCAEGGVAHVTFQTNLDDPPGAYRLICRDRASGLAAERTVSVAPLDR